MAAKTKKEKELDALTEKIRAYFLKWQWIVTGYGWKFDILYHAKTVDKPRDMSTAALGMCRANFPYLDGVLHIDLEIAANIEDDELEEMVVHEMVHMLLSPIQEEDTDMQMLEMVTVWITRDFLKSDKGDTRQIDTAHYAPKNKKTP